MSELKQYCPTCDHVIQRPDPNDESKILDDAIYCPICMSAYAELQAPPKRFDDEFEVTDI